MSSASQPVVTRGSAATSARLLALVIPAALLGGALVSQYGFGLTPCEMCHWQRWPHYFAVAVAALAFLFPAASRNARLLAALAALAIATSGVIGVFHAGVELEYWEGLTRCASAGTLTLDELMKAPLVRCDQVQFEFLGISMAGWNAILSLGAALLIAILLRRKSA